MIDSFVMFPLQDHMCISEKPPRTIPAGGASARRSSGCQTRHPKQSSTFNRRISLLAPSEFVRFVSLSVFFRQWFFRHPRIKKCTTRVELIVLPPVCIPAVINNNQKTNWVLLVNVNFAKIMFDSLNILYFDRDLVMAPLNDAQIGFGF